jgi:hypothetical protein
MDDSGSHWWTTDHDVVKYPLYASAARTSYAAELDRFFEEVAYTNGSYKDLLLSNVGFVNRDNAAIYGLTNSGTAMTKVDLDPTLRPGFLTRVGFLSSFSQYDVTSPIRRGAFITKYLIGVDPGPPVPGEGMINPPPGQYGTNRQVYEALAATSSTCMGCHTNIINPPGYVLENYDAIGQWQTMDHNLFGPIDATATVNFGDGVRKEIHNALELMQELARTKKGQFMYAQSMVAYGYGREWNSADQCVVDAIGGKLAQDGYTILDALAELTQSDSFRLRVRSP